MMKLRKGRTKSFVDASLDAALLAVEVYNKPRTDFRWQAYCSLMIMAWLRLFHAYFHSTIGDRFYYRGQNGRFIRIDNERKAWDVSECIRQYGKLDAAVRANLEFMIALRNKVEHRHVSSQELETTLFGECQALLYNYEALLIQLFGRSFELKTALVYSLQFSEMRTPEQQRSHKRALTKDMEDVLQYIEQYRYGLASEILDSQLFRIRLLQIPVVSNTGRGDVAVEFVRLADLNADQLSEVLKLTTLIKDRRVEVEAANVGRLKPKQVVRKVVNSVPGYGFTLNLHTSLWRLFGVRPPSGSPDPSETVTEFCLYDVAHHDYVYTETWVDLICTVLRLERFSPDSIRAMDRAGERLDPGSY